MRQVYLDYQGGRIKAELATSYWQKMKGMRRRSSGKMLFTFNKAQDPAMEMIGVKKPLWLYGMKKLSPNSAIVVTSKKMKPFKLRDRSTWTTYSPGRPVHYLLESFEKLDLTKDDVVRFTDPELDQLLQS